MSLSISNRVAFPCKEGYSLLYFTGGSKCYQKERKVDRAAQAIFSLVGLSRLGSIIPKAERNQGYWQKVYHAFLIKRREYSEKCAILLSGLFHQTVAEKFKNASVFSGRTKLDICKEFFQNHPMPIPLIKALLDNGQLINEEFEGDYGQFLKGWEEEDVFVTNLLFNCVDYAPFPLPSFTEQDLSRFGQFVKSRAAYCKRETGKSIDWISWYDALYQWGSFNRKANFDQVNALFKILNLPLISKFTENHEVGSFLEFVRKESSKAVSCYFDMIPDYPRESLEVCIWLSEEVRKKILLSLAYNLKLELPSDRPIVQTFANFVSVSKNLHLKNLSYRIFDHHLTEKEWALFSQKINEQLPSQRLLQIMQATDFLRQELKRGTYLDLFMNLLDARNPRVLHLLLTTFFETFSSQNRSFEEVEKTAYLIIEKSLKFKTEPIQIFFCAKLKKLIGQTEWWFPLYFFAEVLFQCKKEEDLPIVLEGLKDRFRKEKISLESEEYERELFFDYFQGHCTYDQMVVLKTICKRLPKPFKLNHKILSALDLQLGRAAPYRTTAQYFEIHDDLSSGNCSSEEEEGKVPGQLIEEKSEKKAVSTTIHQAELVAMALDQGLYPSDFWEALSRLAAKYEFDSLQTGALLFSYFPQEPLLLVQHRDLLVQIETLINHKISSESAFLWLMYAPKGAEKILQDVAALASQMDGCGYTNPQLNQNMIAKLFDWNDDASLPNLKPGRNISDHYKNAFKKGINALAKEIAFATVPYTFQMVSDFFNAESMHPKLSNATKINSLISLSKELQDGLVFFAEWEMPKKRRDQPVFVLSVMNLTTCEATISRFRLPWSEEEIKTHPQILKTLHEASVDENANLGDKKIREYIQTIKTNTHYCLRWLASKKKSLQSAFPTAFLFFGAGNAMRGEHCFSYDHSIPEWLKSFIPQITEAVVRNPFGYKKRYCFISTGESIDLEFIANGNINEVTLTIGEVSQKIRYYTQIHQKNFPLLIRTQILMLLAKSCNRF